MNIFSQFEKNIKEIIESIEINIESPGLIDRISAEPPRDPSHGDLATNAAMVLAKSAGENPRELAGKIASGLEALSSVSKVSIAGPGEPKEIADAVLFLASFSRF